MKTSIDYFDLAVRNTFIKTSKLLPLDSSPSFGAQADPEENNDEPLDCSFKSSLISNGVNSGVSQESFRSNDETNASRYFATKALVEMENLRKMNLNDSINERVHRMMAFEEQLRNKMNTNLLITREEISIKKKLMWKMSESCISDDDLTTTQKFSALLKRYSDAKSIEANNTAKERRAEVENQNQHRTASRWNEIQSMKADYAAIRKKIPKDLEICKNASKLLLCASTELKKIQELTVAFKNIFLNDEANVTDGDIEMGRVILNCLLLLSDKTKQKVAQINEEEIKAEAAKQSIEETDPIVTAENLNESSISATKFNLCEYVCQESLEFYSTLEVNYGKISEQVNEFLKNTSLKGFIRNLKIAINTPVNALSSLNAQHMQDKFRKISDLLRGRFSFPTADISDSTKALYYPFLIDFLCKKFVSHGENLLIPSKSEDAFILASIIVAIWNEFPDFGPVLLAQIMKRCPYSVPAYWPQFQGQSDEDFYVSRGYNYKHDGTIEDQNSFLKRMTGIFMLYVAIMVSIPRTNQLHPHGLSYAWRWLAATINLDPRPDITAALLHVFLDLAGHKLSQYYRLQFWKIMQLINAEYLNKIEKVTTDDFRGPVSRLKEYIAKVLQDGRFREPEGILPANYW